MMRIPRRSPLLPGALLVCVLLPGAQAAAQDVLVQAHRLVLAPDSVLTDSAILVRDGKVAYVGADIPAEARSAARRVDYGDATITPGFVVATSTLGRDADFGETAVAFTPDLRAIEAFDPWQDELKLLPALGVTAIGLAPSARNVAGGIGGLVKPGAAQGRIAEPEAFVGFSLAADARNPERMPTSLMGAKEMLREAFDTAKTGVEIGPDLAVLRQVMAGTRRAVVHADTYAELNAALELSQQFGFQPVLVGAREAAKVLPRLATVGAAVVLDTLDPEGRLATLRLPAQLAEAGVPFCFAGRSDRLRLSAALAVRNGLDRRTALAALTRTPAQLLGLQDRVGALRQGCAADFVVHHGDLLDLGARHVATWIDGRCVFGDEPQQARTATPNTTSAAGDRR